jgi:hypothetical protein
MHGGFQRILRTLRAFTRNSLTFEGEIPPHCPGLNNFHAMTEIGLPVLCIYFRTMWNLCAFLCVPERNFCVKWEKTSRTSLTPFLTRLAAMKFSLDKAACKVTRRMYTRLRWFCRRRRFSGKPALELTGRGNASEYSMARACHRCFPSCGAARLGLDTSPCARSITVENK